MKPAALLCVACIVLFAASICVAAEGSTLEWKLEKKQVFKYKIKTTSELTFNIPRQGPATTKVSLELHPDLEVKSVREGNVTKGTFSDKYEAVIFNIEIPNVGGLSFDSTSEAEVQAARVDPFKIALYNLTRKFKFGHSMTTDGQVSRLSGHNRFVPRAFASRNFKEPVQQAAAMVVSQYMSDKAMEAWFADIFPMLPKGETLPGDKWEGKSSATLYPLGEYGFDNSYMLKEVKDGKVAVFTVNSEVRKISDADAGFGLPSKYDPTRGFFNNILKKMTMKEAKREGEFEFDLESGQIVKGKVSLNMTLAGNFDIFGQSYDIEMKAKLDRTVEKRKEQD